MIEIKECIYKNELIDAYKIRKKVFIDEQHVSYEDEFDLIDDHCDIYIAYLEDKAIGTLRVKSIPEGIKLQRVCVLKEYRMKHIASLLIEHVFKKYPHSIFMVDAQLQAIPFYQKLGFEEQGDIFLDANIEHKKMYKK